MNKTKSTSLYFENDKGEIFTNPFAFLCGGVIATSDDDEVSLKKKALRKNLSPKANLIRHRAGDINLYRFVENNPLRYLDPTGLVKQDEIAITLAAAYLGAGFDADVKASVSREECKSCTPAGKKDLWKSAISIKGNAQVDIGIGGKINVLGFNISAFWKGPQANVVLSSGFGYLIKGEEIGFDITLESEICLKPQKDGIYLHVDYKGGAYGYEKTTYPLLERSDKNFVNQPFSLPYFSPIKLVSW